jgi:GAF domain-containing protein
MTSPKLASDERYAKLLNAAARVAKSVTSILDLDLLLRRTVDIVCDEFHLCHVGVFLLDETGQWAVLRAGQNLASADTLAKGDRLPLDGNSLISAAIERRKAQIVLDVDEEPTLEYLRLPETRSAIVLPLDTGGEMIGALAVQSEEQAAFAPADITTLQIIADQLAIAIKRSDLYRQIQELLYQSVRRARLLGAANAVGRGVASILDLD